MHVVVDNRTNEDLPLDEYRLCAQFVLAKLRVRDDVELSLSLVCLDEMRELNRLYRGIDAPTDVLSFECDGFGEGLGAGFHADDTIASCATATPTQSAFAKPETHPQDYILSNTHDEVFLLGDLIIAPEEARKNAQVFNSSFEEEMDLIIVHGILHLLGFDHIDDDDYAVMKKQEEDLLFAWIEHQDSGVS